MDYKMLHGARSREASSPSTAEGDDARNLHPALPEGAFETVEEVEGLLAGVGKRAPEALVEPTLGSLTSEGKRLRPLLLVLCAEMGEPERGDLLRAATAIEILHTATLIHDDIVDKAKSRRGVPTSVARYGREIAVATGDYLFAEAFSELAEIGDPRLVRAFSEASEGLAAGELGQYRANGATVEVDAYLEHIRKKTAGLFKAACVAGGTLGGLSLRQINSLATYGQALGIAFQMSEGTVTLPVIFALREGDAQTIRRVLAAPEPSPELLEAGIEAVLATEAVTKTEEWARGEVDGALEGLELLPDCPEREFLEVIASEVVGRDA